jgi:hypothetical protein
MTTDGMGIRLQLVTVIADEVVKARRRSHEWKEER